MESLLRFHRRPLPPPRPLPLPLTKRPSPPHLLVLPPPLYSRGASLVARAEPQTPPAAEGAASGSSSEAPASSQLASSAAPGKKPVDGTGVGFGRAASAEAGKKGKGRERSSVVRRSPMQRSSLLYSEGGDSPNSTKQQQQTGDESAFLLTWLGLGFLILVEGVALAASGFLPEQWDSFLVKYLYPSFTPTVFLFVGGTVAYGVYKYLQAEKMNK